MKVDTISDSIVTVEIGDSPKHWRIFIPILPVPASRPRVTRWGTYYGKRYTEFRTIAKKLLQAVEWPCDFPLRGLLSVSVTFTVPRPKTTKRQSPRGDVDNYFKTLDSLNEVVWKDDDQIVWAIMAKEYGEPGIRLEIKEIDRIPKTRALPEM
jgi:Holliday junction resolvase RusA-like endonuclease